MDNKNTFLIGAGLGLALGYFLNSNKGRDIQKKTVEYVGETAETLRTQSNDLISKATEVASGIKDKGNQYLKEMDRSQVTSKDVEQFVESKVNSLKDDLMGQVQEFVESTNHVNA